MTLAVLLSIGMVRDIQFNSRPQTLSLSTSPSIVLPVLVRNATPSKVTFWSCGFWPNHRVILKDMNGVLVTRTKLGKQAELKFGTKIRDKNAPIVLAPGEKYKYSTPDLKSIFELKPGRYKFSITYQEKYFDDKMTLSTSDLELSIIP